MNSNFIQKNIIKHIKSIYSNLFFRNREFKAIFSGDFILSLQYILNDFRKKNNIKYYLFIEEYLDLFSMISGYYFSERAEEVYKILYNRVTLTLNEFVFIYVLASEKKVKIFYPRFNKEANSIEVLLEKSNQENFQRELIYILNEKLILSDEVFYFS